MSTQAYRSITEIVYKRCIEVLVLASLRVFSPEGRWPTLSCAEYGQEETARLGGKSGGGIHAGIR